MHRKYSAKKGLSHLTIIVCEGSLSRHNIPMVIWIYCILVCVLLIARARRANHFFTNIHRTLCILVCSYVSNRCCDSRWYCNSIWSAELYGYLFKLQGLPSLFFVAFGIARITPGAGSRVAIQPKMKSYERTFVSVPNGGPQVRRKHYWSVIWYTFLGHTAFDTSNMREWKGASPYPGGK